MTMTFGDHLFKRCYFGRMNITVCVRWYVSYQLSYRDLAEMMAERGLSVAHTAIMRLGAQVRPRCSKSAGARAIVCRHGLEPQV